MKGYGPRTKGQPAASSDPQRLAWHAFVDALFENDWVVYAKPAFGGDGERVTFTYKDYARGDQRRTLTLTAMEFATLTWGFDTA